MNDFEKWLEREKKNDRKERITIIIIVISALAFATIFAFSVAKIVYLNQKEDYYSHKTIVIDNIEYNIKDTEFISHYEEGELVIKLPNGDEIHTNHYKFKN